jgi:hypothetical protein
MPSELLLVRVSSVRATKLRRRTAARRLKNGCRTFAIRNTASHCTKLVHDDLVCCWNTTSCARRRAIGATIRVKELNIDRAHRGEPGPRSCASVKASFKPGLYWAIVRLREVMDGPPPHRIFQFSHPLAIGTNPYTLRSASVRCGLRFSSRTSSSSLPARAIDGCFAAQGRCGGLDRWPQRSCLALRCRPRYSLAPTR